MSHTVLLTRALPLPPVDADGAEITFCPISPDGPFPSVAKVLLSTALDPVDADMISRLPDNIGLIANLGVGTDNVDLDAAKARGILVSNTPVVTEDTADLAFALLLSAARKVGANERFLRAGRWTQTTPFAAMGTRVSRKTLGVVGFGKIGQAVARRAKGFGMDILYWNRSAKAGAENELGAERIKKLSELLSKSDFVSIHLPLTKATNGLIDTGALSSCKPGAILINTARGPVVDESALVVALKTKTIAAAGLDVFEREPEIHPELIDMEQVILSPHIGSATSECRKDIVMRGLANVVSFLESGTILDPA